MINRVSEKKMHLVRWVLVIAWLVLIVSLFYDPVSSVLTSPENLNSPFSLSREIFTPQGCIKVQANCLLEQTYPMGARIWWSMIVPAGILIIFVLGHEFWRRICPLYFVSQIPTALGIQRKKRVVNPITGKSTLKLALVAKDSWLGRNHLYLQFGFLFWGLVARILAINSHRTVLGVFLILTMLSAIAVGYLYGGKSWCNYFCPMATVQTLYTGPRGLLGTPAYQTQSRITQSMCRIVDDTGAEKSGCVGCKSSCIDIDAERSYWEELKKPGRRLTQYGYFGLMFGFYFYYFAYAGNWNYYFSGVWTHEENQLATIFAPGLYLFHRSIPIPKAIAVVFTFTFLIGLSYLFFMGLEKAYRAYGKHLNQSVSSERSRHIVFSLCTVISFWVFFSYAARPNLNLLPAPALMAFNAFVVFVGSIWLYRTLGRSREQYNREKIANSLRKQLTKLNLDLMQFFPYRSLEDLNPDELHVLTKVLPEITQKEREQFYCAVMKETLEEGIISLVETTKVLKNLRQELNINEAQHSSLLDELIEMKNS